VTKDLIDDYFDTLNQKIAGNCVSYIIATFERIVFARIDNACGEIKSIILSVVFENVAPSGLHGVPTGCK